MPTYSCTLPLKHTSGSEEYIVDASDCSGGTNTAHTLFRLESLLGVAVEGTGAGSVSIADSLRRATGGLAVAAATLATSRAVAVDTAPESVATDAAWVLVCGISTVQLLAAGVLGAVPVEVARIMRIVRGWCGGNCNGLMSVRCVTIMTGVASAGTAPVSTAETAFIPSRRTSEGTGSVGRAVTSSGTVLVSSFVSAAGTTPASTRWVPAATAAGATAGAAEMRLAGAALVSAGVASETEGVGMEATAASTDGTGLWTGTEGS